MRASERDEESRPEASPGGGSRPEESSSARESAETPAVGRGEDRAATSDGADAGGGQSSSHADEVDDLPGGLTPVPRRFGATERGAFVTLLLLVLVALVLQHQLRDPASRGGSPASSTNPSGGAAEADGDDGAPASARPSFRGRIVDMAGRPLSGARVRLGGGEETTDSDGRFALWPARGPLRVEHPECWPRELPEGALALLAEAARVEDAGGEVTAAVVRAMAIDGSVHEESGRPIAGARVVVSAGALIEPEVDDQGRFRVPRLAAMPVAVRAFAAGRVPREIEILPERDGLRRTVALSLRRGSPFEVSVATAEGDAIAGAHVELRTILPAAGGGGAQGTWRLLGSTDEDGLLRAARTGLGAARVRVSCPGFHGVIRPAIGRGARVRLQRVPLVEGTAVDADSGLPIELREAIVEERGAVEFEPVSPSEQIARIAAGGKFFAGLPPRPGLYRIVLRGAGRRSGHSDTVRVPSPPRSETLVVELRPESGIGGRIWGVGAGWPVELLSVPDPDAPPQEIHGLEVRADHELVRTVETGTDGAFRFTGVPPGLYRLHCRRRGWMEWFSPAFTLPLAEELAIFPRPGATLAGKVLRPDGVPEVGAPLVLMSDGPLMRVLRTDAGGHYRFEDLPPGRFTLGLGVRQAGDAVVRRTLEIQRDESVVYNLRRR